MLFSRPEHLFGDSTNTNQCKVILGDMKKLVDFRLSAKATLIRKIAYFVEYWDPNHINCLHFDVIFGSKDRFIGRGGSTKSRYNPERLVT